MNWKKKDTVFCTYEMEGFIGSEKEGQIVDNAHTIYENKNYGSFGEYPVLDIHISFRTKKTMEKFSREFRKWFK